LISDLHLDRWGGQTPDYVRMKMNQILVVAGDVHRNPEETAKEIAKMAAVYKTVLFVEGNNEYRDPFLTEGNFNIADNEAELRRLLRGIPNAVYLKDGPFEQDGVAFVGRYGHWDHKACPGISQEDAITEQFNIFAGVLNRGAGASAEVKDQIAKQDINGAKARRAPAPVTREDAVGIVRQAEADVRELRAEIAGLNARDDIHSIIVVTHTVPMAELVDQTGTPWRISTMSNTALDSILEADTRHKVKHWVFGHQHSQRTGWMGDVPFATNPLGNPGEIYQLGHIDSYHPARVWIPVPQHAPKSKRTPKATP
jgi:hypothetical protein